MSDNDTFRSSASFTLRVILIIATGIIFVMASYSVGWTTGYEQGHKIARAYYNVTGELPTRQWIDDANNWKLTRKYQILDSIEEMKKSTSGE